MNLTYLSKVLVFGLSGYLVFTGTAFAHDPVFSPGPHVLFKDGFEVHTEYTQSKQGSNTESEPAVAVKYGLSGDWVAGIEMPYQTNTDASGRQSGIGDMTLSTKFRFWRDDTLGLQKTAAILAKVKLNTGNSAVSTGTTDSLLGLTYGYESLKWYRWASVRYRFNQTRQLNNQTNLQRGNRFFVDFVGGYRTQVNDYREPDMVWLLELNGEYGQRNAINGVDISNSGGREWFVSPGLMWTLRNFAVKTGVQVPIYSNLNGSQANSDYRARVELEWHL